MKGKNTIKKIILICMISSVACIAGCSARETVVTREWTEEGENSMQNTVIKERKRPGLRTVVEKQSVSETVQCIGKSGMPINVDSVEECKKKGGRIIDEVVIKQQKMKK